MAPMPLSIKLKALVCPAEPPCQGPSPLSHCLLRPPPPPHSLTPATPSLAQQASSCCLSVLPREGPPLRCISTWTPAPSQSELQSRPFQGAALPTLLTSQPTTTRPPATPSPTLHFAVNINLYHILNVSTVVIICFQALPPRKLHHLESWSGSQVYTRHPREDLLPCRHKYSPTDDRLRLVPTADCEKHQFRSALAPARAGSLGRTGERSFAEIKSPS